MELSERIASRTTGCIRNETKALVRYGLKRQRLFNEKEEERQRDRERIEAQRPKPEEMMGISMRDLLSADIPNASDLRICGPICAGDFVLIGGPTNIGKSIGGVQIAIDIGMGCQSELFPPMKVCGLEHIVYYYDGEMRLSQFKERYHGLSARTLDEHLVRFSPETHERVCTPEGLMQLIIHVCKEATKNIAFVVDNLTDLCDKGDMNLKRFYKCLKKARNIMSHKGLYFTAIILVHLQSTMNKKIIDRPLTPRDFKAGGVLPNFFDCVLGIRGFMKDDINVQYPYVDIMKTRIQCDIAGFPTKRISEPYAMLRYAAELVTTNKGRQESDPDDNDPLGGGGIGAKRRYTKVAGDDIFDEIVSYFAKEAHGNATITAQHFGCTRQALYINFEKRYGKNWRENINITIQKEDISMDSADMDFDSDDDFSYDDD